MPRSQRLDETRYARNYLFKNVLFWRSHSGRQFAHGLFTPSDMSPIPPHILQGEVQNLASTSYPTHV